ncbi:gp162 [Sphingomonas phage PAU]|uniref:gp162 n=1 Tax=Sphingomonas phage PAU TaxID=1150991 RepID=UPI00025732EE|nr:gp162 [Sphingomonas phage PAU]AFF28160.1 gp162 [Sphingomonas phage PAU]
MVGYVFLFGSVLILSLYLIFRNNGSIEYVKINYDYSELIKLLKETFRIDFESEHYFIETKIYKNTNDSDVIEINKCSLRNTSYKYKQILFDVKSGTGRYDDLSADAGDFDPSCYIVLRHGKIFEYKTGFRRNDYHLMHENTAKIIKDRLVKK